MYRSTAHCSTSGCSEQLVYVDRFELSSSWPRQVIAKCIVALYCIHFQSTICYVSLDLRLDSVLIEWQNEISCVNRLYVEHVTIVCVCVCACARVYMCLCLWVVYFSCFTVLWSLVAYHSHLVNVPFFHTSSAMTVFQRVMKCLLSKRHVHCFYAPCSYHCMPLYYWLIC